MSIRSGERKIKVLVWDLDNTLWAGTLAEDDHVSLRPGLMETIKVLDQRGILQSIASKNDHENAMTKLRQLCLDTYFLYPQINWSPKSESITRIKEALNLGMDSIAFIDDQSFERAEVAFNHDEVLCLDAQVLPDLLAMPELNPRFITQDSSLRRAMYQADVTRNQLEESFEGPKESFLASLEMVFEIGPAKVEDLRRAEELTMRTNQLNTTGYTYAYEELAELCQSPVHKLLIAGLEDNHGSYGRIGLVLLDLSPEVWSIKLLLMSCRVMARGVGSLMINYLKRLAADHGVALHAEFIHTDRNRMMFMTYKFAGFKQVEKNGKRVLLAADLSVIPPDPEYLTLNAHWGS